MDAPQQVVNQDAPAPQRLWLVGDVARHLALSRKAVYGYDQRVEILGSGGSIATANCYPNEAVVSTAKEVRRDLPLNFFMERYTESFVNELRAFVKAVAEDKPTPVTGMDGRIPVVMGLAARKSHDERRPVRLSEIG